MVSGDGQSTAAESASDGENGSLVADRERKSSWLTQRMRTEGGATRTKPPSDEAAALMLQNSLLKADPHKSKD